MSLELESLGLVDEALFVDVEFFPRLVELALKVLARVLLGQVVPFHDDIHARLVHLVLGHDHLVSDRVALIVFSLLRIRVEDGLEVVLVLRVLMLL